MEKITLEDRWERGQGDERMALSEVVAALSFALDLTEDAVPGHAVRSCLIGTRLGMELGLDEAARHDLYYALLLKDVGCSSNSARMCQILGGDDRKAKRDVKLIDWTKPSVAAVKMAWGTVLPGASPLRRAVRILRMGMQQDANNAEMVTLRCERGADIVRKIGLSERCADAIYGLDEHWNGSGYPERLKGEQIPLMARILCLAQHLDVFAGEQGTARALETMDERSGSWFDPELARVARALALDGALWQGCRTPDEHALVVEMEPGTARTIGPEEVDRVCEAFADVVDAKSAFTYRHSMGVKDAALGIARQMGFTGERLTTIYRAALLHDLGKLGVSNSILDKPGKLTVEEFEVLKAHPVMSREILERIPSFAEIASIAGKHHERLDGFGYPDRLPAEALTVEDRIIALADVYGALSEDRPYRAGLSEEKVLSILTEDVPTKHDPACFEALLAYMAEKREGRIA
jgi:HD-GYP domain-containing protein (c-di-GMP phosphodiesterase class II)